MELIVVVVLGGLISAVAYAFYRNMMGQLERQKQVNTVQTSLKDAVDCINRFFIAGGVSGDSLFFDPNRILSVPIVNGGHRVFDLNSDSTDFIIYGNFSGSATAVSTPILSKTQGNVTVDKPGLFRAGGYIYIYAGSAQEVARVTNVNGSVLSVANPFYVPYPKGTLVFPLERIRVQTAGKKRLFVRRESANGDKLFERDFIPSSHPNDSLEFKIRSVDRQAGQIAYALTFAATTQGRKKLKLIRRSDQTVFVRGF